MPRQSTADPSAQARPRRGRSGSRPSSSSKTKSATAKRGGSAPLGRLRVPVALRRVGAKVRDVGIGLGLIVAISFVPPSISDEWPELAQRAVAITREVRALVLDVGADVLAHGSAWLSETGSELVDDGGAVLADAVHGAGNVELSGWLPDLGQWLPDLGVALTDWLSDLLPAGLSALLGDWWPQPTLPAGGGDLPRVAGSFSAAKDLLYEQVYRGQRVTAYCGCTYNGRREVDLGSCGLEGYAGNARARRVEAEHVFPAAQFGNFRRCWRQPEAYRECREQDGDLVSGRECCLRVDETFVAAHNDLQNLIPAVGMINGDRRDYSWGMAPDGKRYGDCRIRIDSGGRRVQPPDALRGDIARIMLYMRDTYGFRLSRQDARLFAAWSKVDPVDDWERKREARIARLQGVENGYVVGDGL